MNGQFIEIFLGDENYFKLIRGTRITRKDIFKHPGEIPVISGHKEEDSYLGKVSEKWLIENNILIYTKPMITINSNGNVGKVYLRTLDKYAIHDDVTGLDVINTHINLEYCVYSIREAIALAQFKYDAKLYMRRLKKLGIKFPLNGGTAPDIKAQEELALKFEKLQSLKDIIKNFSENVSNKFIVLDMNQKNLNLVSLGNEKYFRLIRGKRIRKKDIHSNPGKIPVISSSGEEEKYLGFISKKWLEDNKHPLFNRPMITINADGSVGNVFIRREPEYTFIDVVIGVELLDSNLDKDYIKHSTIEAIAEAKFKYDAKLYTKRLKKLEIKIPIINGIFDIMQQQQDAERYNRLEELKKTIERISKELDEKFIIAQ